MDDNVILIYFSIYNCIYKINVLCVCYGYKENCEYYIVFPFFTI